MAKPQHVATEIHGDSLSSAWMSTSKTVKTTSDLDALITRIPSGSMIDVQLVALNEAGSEGPCMTAQRITIA